MFGSRPLFSPDAPPGGAPTATTIPAPGAPNPADVIQLPRAEYEKLVKAGGQSETLEAKLKEVSSNWDQARTLFSKEQQDPTKLAEATRFMLKSAGYSDAEIEAHLAPEPEPEPQPQPTPNGRGRPAAAPADDPRLTSMEQQIKALQQEHGQSRLTQLQGMFDTNLDRALDSNPELATLMKSFVGLRGTEDPSAMKAATDEVRSTLRDELDRTLRERLRVRRSSSGNAWRDEWIGEEAVEAAKAVYGKFKRIVGDPSRLGRTPETINEDSSIHTKPPVPVPEYKPGVRVPEAKAGVERAITDAFLRMAAPKPSGV